MPSKEAAACFLLVALMVSLGSATTTFGAPPSSRFHIKRDRPPSFPSRRTSSDQQTARHDTGFDPDVLNRFLEEYASKIKRIDRPSNYQEDAKAESGERNEDGGDMVRFFSGVFLSFF